MGYPVDFVGSNQIYGVSDEQADVGIVPIHTFNNGFLNVTMWRLTPEEIEEIVRTGIVCMSVMSGEHFFPAMVGSESSVRACALDYGKTWPPLEIVEEAA